MSNIKALPITGFANCNGDVAVFLRELANTVEGNCLGDVRQALVVFEVDGELDTWVAGGPCDNARVVGLLSIAAQKFIKA